MRGHTCAPETRLRADAAAVRTRVPRAPCGEHTVHRTSVLITPAGFRQVRAFVASVLGMADNTARARLRPRSARL